MSAMASHITSVSIVYSIACSGADQRKYQSSVSLAFVRGIHLRGKSFHFMTSSWNLCPVCFVIRWEKYHLRVTLVNRHAYMTKISPTQLEKMLWRCWINVCICFYTPGRPGNGRPVEFFGPFTTCIEISIGSQMKLQILQYISIEIIEFSSGDVLFYVSTLNFYPT